MAIKDVVKVSRKTFINPRAWFGYDAVKAQTKTIASIIKPIATPDKPVREETFKAATKRLELETRDLEITYNAYLTYAYLFLSLSLFSFTYGIYLILYHGTFLGLVLTLAVTGLFISQAFKYHFWAFQIKKAKLGCTFKEWRDETFGLKKRGKH
jgi:intracellular multiplication protein IcmV